METKWYVGKLLYFFDFPVRDGGSWSVRDHALLEVYQGSTFAFDKRFPCVEKVVDEKKKYVAISCDDLV